MTEKYQKVPRGEKTRSLSLNFLTVFLLSQTVFTPPSLHFLYSSFPGMYRNPSLHFSSLLLWALDSFDHDSIERILSRDWYPRRVHSLRKQRRGLLNSYIIIPLGVSWEVIYLEGIFIHIPSIWCVLSWEDFLLESSITCPDNKGRILHNLLLRDHGRSDTSRGFLRNNLVLARPVSVGEISQRARRGKEEIPDSRFQIPEMKYQKCIMYFLQSPHLSPRIYHLAGRYYTLATRDRGVRFSHTNRWDLTKGMEEELSACGW